MSDETPTLNTADSTAELEVRDLAQREIGIRIVPWDREVTTRNGPELFIRGAFADVDPTRVVLRMDHQNPPAGRGLSLEERDDGAYMAFRVSKTQRGDEILELAADGVATGASVGFFDLPGGTEIQTRSGRRTRVVRKADLREVSTTWLPTWQEASVQYVRSTEEEPVTEQTVEAPTPAAAPVVDLTPITALMTEQQEMHKRAMEQLSQQFTERLTGLEERQRKDIVIPAGQSQDSEDRAKRGDWMQVVLSMLAGQRPNELQMRELSELITSDNVGVVPDAYLTELIGVIDPRRAFLGTTRRLDLPAAGMSLVVPKIVTRPETGVQAAEKDELASNQTSITTATFDAITIGGAGDISLQLLRRSSPAFLSLYLELLAESLAQNAEIEALQALLAAGVTAGGAMDPEDLSLGAAWKAGAAVNVPVDTIWASSEAMGAFIDAKADGSNLPLYSTIQSAINAGGQTGTVSGLRLVHVPALDTASATVDVIVGPSRGFGWTEDGTYTLQVDVPAKAGRDVALVSLLWFAPMYPSAFTTFTIAS